MDPNDPRAQRTRQALIDAFVELAAEVNYGDLTIRALTKRANVGYATFFRHYKSLDDILLLVLRGAFLDVDEQMSAQPTMYDEVLTMYRFVNCNASLFRLFFSLAPTHPTRQLLVAGSREFVRSRYRKRPSSHAPLDLSIDLILSNTHRLMKWYLERLNEYTPEQIAAIHYDFVVSGTQTAVSFLQPHRPPRTT